jgi:hypothetical protein
MFWPQKQYDGKCPGLFHHIVLGVKTNRHISNIYIYIYIFRYWARDQGIESLVGDHDAPLDVPPPQPPPPPLLEPMQPPPVVLPVPGNGAGGRSRATASYEVEGGTIYFYSRTNRFTAVCSDFTHGSNGDCTLTRSATKRAHMHGRPVAFMSAFLEAGRATCCKQEHWDMIPAAQDLDTLIRHRDAANACDEGRIMMSFERVPEPGEGDL